MKKFLSSVSLAALAIGFTLQGSHAMNQDEEPQQGMKRLLPVGQVGNPEVPSTNPEVPSTNGIPFSTLGITPLQFQDILVPYTSFHPKTDIIWEHRLVSKTWESILNLYVKTLDLSPKWQVPFERRVELMNSSVPVQINHCYRFFKGYLFDQGTLLCWKDKKEANGIYETQLIQGGFDIIECDLWKSALVRDYETDQITGNPLLSFNYDINIDLGQFPYLQNLFLRDNAAISDENLRQAINLRLLDLTNNDLITDQSVSQLTNLTKLDLYCTKNVTEEAVILLTNLKTLALDADRGSSQFFGYDFDYSKLFENPCLRQLIYREEDGNLENEQQAQMNVIEGLFLFIEKNDIKRNNAEYQALKSWYEMRVLLPHIFGLGYDKYYRNVKRKSKYNLNLNNISFSDDDRKYYDKLKNMRDIPDEASDDIYVWCVDFHKEIEQKIVELIKISGKDLEINWRYDEYIQVD